MKPKKSQRDPYLLLLFFQIIPKKWKWNSTFKLGNKRYIAERASTSTIHSCFSRFDLHIRMWAKSNEVNLCVWKEQIWEGKGWIISHSTFSKSHRYHKIYFKKRLLQLHHMIFGHHYADSNHLLFFCYF